MDGFINRRAVTLTAIIFGLAVILLEILRVFFLDEMLGPMYSAVVDALSMLFLAGGAAATALLLGIWRLIDLKRKGRLAFGLGAIIGCTTILLYVIYVSAVADSMSNRFDSWGLIGVIVGRILDLSFFTGAILMALGAFRGLITNDPEATRGEPGNRAWESVDVRASGRIKDSDISSETA